MPRHEEATVSASLIVCFPTVKITGIFRHHDECVRVSLKILARFFCFTIRFCFIRKYALLNIKTNLAERNRGSIKNQRICGEPRGDPPLERREADALIRR
jgi:hypothetical protein